VHEPVQPHVAPDARERAVIAILLSKIDEAVAFAEAVQGADITYADYGLIEDHLASLDVAQIGIGRPAPKSGVLSSLYNGERAP
jgi:hypothetical protein